MRGLVDFFAEIGRGAPPAGLSFLMMSLTCILVTTVALGALPFAWKGLTPRRARVLSIPPAISFVLALFLGIATVQVALDGIWPVSSRAPVDAAFCSVVFLGVLCFGGTLPVVAAMALPCARVLRRKEAPFWWPLLPGTVLVLLLSGVGLSLIMLGGMAAGAVRRAAWTAPADRPAMLDDVLDRMASSGRFCIAANGVLGVLLLVTGVMVAVQASRRGFLPTGRMWASAAALALLGLAARGASVTAVLAKTGSCAHSTRSLANR